VTDQLLDRIQVTAVVWCGAAAVVALVVSGGHVAPVIGVLGGGMLAGVSYVLIKGGISGLAGFAMRSADRSARSRVGARALVKLVFRYALLVILAYVMIARLRLHPLGLIAGASSVVAAAAIEAGRLLLKKS
jgi:hypothetical protein